MSATRRAFLRGLGALPVAAVPTVALPAVAAPSPDAALIEIARRTRSLAVLEDKAERRRADAEESFDELAWTLKRPGDCDAEISASTKAIMDACPTPVTLADNDVLFAYMRRAGQAAAAIRERHAAEQDTYEAERARLRVETGLEHAEEVSEWLCARLTAAVQRIVDTPSRTPAGLHAKASVWSTITAFDYWSCEGYWPWLNKLAFCIAAEAGTIGGAA